LLKEGVCVKELDKTESIQLTEEQHNEVIRIQFEKGLTYPQAVLGWLKLQDKQVQDNQTTDNKKFE
jgi:hypothetical protein